MKMFKKLLFLLDANELKKLCFLLIMILIMALLEMMGVASVLPFMAILANPDIVETNNILKTIFEFSNKFGIENNHQFLFAMGIVVFVLLIFSLIFKALTTYFQLRFIFLLEYSLSKRLVTGYLHQPYNWFLNRHSSDIGKTILSEVGQVVGSGINQIVEIIAKSMVVIALTTLLILTNPKLALIVGFVLGVAYWLIYKFTKNYLDYIGKKRLKSNEFRFKSISEAFSAAKEIKVGGLEEAYIKRYAEPARFFALFQATASAVSQLPRFALEAIAFGGVILMILYLMAITGDFDNALPVISLYVFAGYRLLPALQQIYASFSKLAFFGPSFNNLYDDFKNIYPIKLNQNKDILSLNKEIILKDIYYNYPNASRTALKGINLKIPVKTTVGLVGATGSGKTTTVDIILGLLEAQKGDLEVDGQIINKQNSRAWQRSIGYVPQNIYLSDDTISANIAIGIESKDINQEAVEKACKIANLHDFISNELPNKYQTTIGERGIRLSGGQRQRIGIARALYHEPKVLILDEATSSLDNLTERKVMDEVNKLSKDITVIIIAHRLSSIKKCDKIFYLENGRIKNQGTFDELVDLDDNFRANTQNT